MKNQKPKKGKRRTVVRRKEYTLQVVGELGDGPLLDAMIYILSIPPVSDDMARFLEKARRYRTTLQ